MTTIFDALRRAVGPDELMLLVALALIAGGFWDAWRPGTFLIPGLALLWIALPSRLPFIAKVKKAHGSPKEP